MNDRIEELFDELLQKYKKAQTIVIMNDSGDTHKKLTGLDHEIDDYTKQLQTILKNG